MKAVVQYALGGADVLQIEEVEIPSIQQGELLIEGHYTSVNYADIKTRIGSKGKPTFPFSLGLDIVGTVSQSNSRSFNVGDKVIAFPKDGSYKQFAVASEKLAFKIPSDFDLQQAAAMPTVSILSYILLHEIGQVQPGDTIVIHSAAGGVGTMLTKLAKLHNVQTIIGTVGNAAKKDYVLSNGATAVYTYDQFASEVNAIGGANVVFDSMAGDVTAASLSCLVNYGTLVQFGNSSGKAGTISTNDVHNSCRNVKGFSLGTTRKEAPSRLQPVVEQLIPLFETGDLHIPIAQIFPLSAIQEAHHLIESRAYEGKILIKLH